MRSVCANKAPVRRECDDLIYEGKNKRIAQSDKDAKMRINIKPQPAMPDLTATEAEREALRKEKERCNEFLTSLQDKE